MPVYNEAGDIERTLRSWIDVLDESGASYELCVIDDGSKDGSADVLARVDGIRVWSKENEGHGPTILRGYRDALDRAEWVFQTDSDDEIPASAFPGLWSAREDHDAVLGIRTNRTQHPVRKVMTVTAKWTVRLAYGGRVQDVNCPFRLMRTDVLAPVLERIPDDTFAPNPVISGALARNGADIVEVGVPFKPREGETGAGLGKKAPMVFFETLRLAPRFRGRS